MTHKKGIYLDNAASSFPKPKSVIREMTRVMKRNTSNPGRSGHSMAEENEKLIFDARAKAAEFFGIPHGEEKVVFTHSATHAVNIVVGGLLRKGMRVLISDTEHNSVLRPLAEGERKGELKYKIAKTCESEAETLESFKKAMDSGVDAVFINHASNVSGNILPVEKIGELCREKNAVFCVDASQSAGHIPCDVNAFNADFLITSGHKGLLGPQGTGILLINGDILPEPIIFGGTGGDSLLKIQPRIIPEGLESGTQNTVGIAGLSAGIDYVRKNFDRISQKTLSLKKYAWKGLERIGGVKLYGDPSSPIPIISFNINNIHSEKTAALLNESGIFVRGGYHCAALFHEKNGTVRQGAVRISMGENNTEKHLRKLISQCEKIAKIQS